MLKANLSARGGSKRNNKASLIPIFFTVFMDMLGVGIVIPILAPLFLDQTMGVLPFSYSFSTRAMILGFIIASYPLAQFVGAPMLGALSDRYGRKKILVISLIGTLIGYLLFGFGIVLHNIFLLFFARLLDGFTGGNISTALSSISDVSESENKTKNFGFVGVAFGLGFIIGPFIGGKLSDPSVVSWFNFAVPFWFSGFLTILNLLLVAFLFKETLKVKSQTQVSFLSGFTNVYKAFKSPELRVVFLMIFLLTLGFNFFVQFFQVYLIERFKLSQSQIGDLFAYIGLWIAVGQGLITSRIAKKHHPLKVIPVSTFILACSFILIFIPFKSLDLFVVLPFIAVLQGLVQPNYTTLISDLSAKDAQGEVMGINQSVQSIAQAVPPMIAGFIVSIHVGLPIIVASLCTFAAWIVFVFLFKKGKAKAYADIPA